MATLLANTTGQADLREEHISKIVTGFALQEYRMKEVVMVQPSSAWQESYYQESKTELTGGTGSAVEGVPRLANFPYGEVTWTKKEGYMKKHAMEGVISWEDATTNNIDVIARTLLRIARAVAKSVDDDIWDVITQSRTGSDINSVAITAGNEWDSATIANRDPIKDILTAIKEIQVDNYDPLGGNGYLLVNPKDFANLMANPNVRNAGQFYTAEVTRNGYVGRLCGLKVIVSNSVTADYAAVVAGKECATYKVAQELRTVSVADSGIKYTIRSWEIGVCQLTNPEAVCLISNTAA